MPKYIEHDGEENFDFDTELGQERAWSVFECFASGRIEEVAECYYRNLRSFYNASRDYVKSVKNKKLYKARLEEVFGIHLN